MNKTFLFVLLILYINLYIINGNKMRGSVDINNSGCNTPNVSKNSTINNGTNY